MAAKAIMQNQYLSYIYVLELGHKYFLKGHSMRVKKSPVSNQKVFNDLKMYDCQGNHAKSIFLITTKIGYSCLIAHIFII